MDTPFNYTEPDWKPLERAMLHAKLPIDTCGEFMWMQGAENGVQSYKHRNTRSYIHLAMNTPEMMCGRMLHEVRHGL